MPPISFTDDYLKYLRSPEWKKTRNKRISLDQGRCQNCGATIHLQVHHLNYDSVGDETEDDIEVLCKECHEDKEIEKGTDIHEDDDYGEY